MLSPYFLEHFADAYLPLAAQLDEIITRDIARRIMKAGVLTSTAKHQIDMAQQCGLLYEDIIKDVAAYTKQSEPLVRKMFDDAGAIAVSYDTAIYAAAGLIAKPLSQSRKAQNVLQAGIRKTNGLIKNLTKTTASEAQRIFINAATIAEMQVESGAFDTSSALRNAIKAAASDGGYIRYPIGHRDRLDVAMRRAMQTDINQTSAAMSIAYAEDMACDLVEVSAHIGARESHAKWQGKVYSLTGATRGYQKLSDATGYGTGDGLCGWNCRHSFFPYFETLSQEAYPKEMLEDMKSATVAFNGKELPYYDATQMQRAMERAIRDTKRQYCAYDEAAKAGKSADALRSEADKAAILLKKQRDKYTDFVTQVGFKPDIARTLTQEFGHSQASKATWVLKKAAKESILKSNNKHGNIEITPDAINSVKGFKSSILSAAAVDDLVLANQALLLDAMKYEVGTELARTFTLDMQPLNDAVGVLGGGTVKMADESVDYILTHNHPDGYSFSPNDIRLFAERRNMTVLCTVCNDGKVFVAEKTKNTKMQTLANYAQDTNEQMKAAKSGEAFFDIHAKFLKELEKFGLLYYEI